MKPSTRFRPSGFTLIEMVIVMVIASIIIAVILSLAKPYFAEQQRQKQINSIRTVEQALEDHLEQKGFYPCPAPLDSARSSALDGIGSCTANATPGQIIHTANGRGGREVLIGSVPYRDLNLSVEASIDTFNNRLTYAVTKDSATLGSYEDDLDDLAAHSGGIDIVDNAGLTLLADAGTEHVVHFSHGQNGLGAYTNEGVPYGAGGCGGTVDSENCNNDASFVAALQSRGATAQYYDDMSSFSLLVDGEEDDLWDRSAPNFNDIHNINTANVIIGNGIDEKDPIIPNPGHPYEAKFSVFGNGIALESDGPHGIISGTTYSDLGQSNFIGYRGAAGGGLLGAADQSLVTFQGRGAGVTASPTISGAGMRIYSAEPFTANSMGSYLTLDTVPSGTTSKQERLRITEDGNIGIGTAAPNSVLQIEGEVQISTENAAFPANCPASKAGALRYNTGDPVDPADDLIEMCDGQDWRGNGFLGGGTNFLNVDNLDLPAPYTFTGFSPGQWVVIMHLRGNETGGGANYYINATVNGVEKVFHVTNHPDGTSEFAFSAVVDVNASGEIEVTNTGGYPWTIQNATFFQMAGSNGGGGALNLSFRSGNFDMDPTGDCTKDLGDGSVFDFTHAGVGGNTGATCRVDIPCGANEVVIGGGSMASGSDEMVTHLTRPGHNAVRCRSASWQDSDGLSFTCQAICRQL